MAYRAPGSLSYALSAIVVVAALALVGYVLVEAKVVPASYKGYLYAVLWLLGSVTVTHLVSSAMRQRLTPLVGEANAASVGFVFRLAGYVVALIGFLALIRIGITEALAAGGFAGLVVGLASQFILSNVFGGITIILTRPYRVGDRITFTTWQYGMLAPAYPPKFFSQDFLIPGYTGVVKEINLMYTVILTDDNVPVKVPNAVMAQAAIFVHSESDARRVRTKYEVPKELDVDAVLRAVEEAVSRLDIVVGKPSVKVIDTSQTTYVIAVDALCRTLDEEPARSEIIKAVMRAVRQVQESLRQTTKG